MSTCKSTWNAIGELSDKSVEPGSSKLKVDLEIGLKVDLGSRLESQLQSQ